MLKIRRSRDRLIVNMGIPIPRKDGLYIETGPVINITFELHIYQHDDTMTGNPAATCGPHKWQ